MLADKIYDSLKKCLQGLVKPVRNSLHGFMKLIHFSPFLHLNKETKVICSLVSTENRIPYKDIPRSSKFLKL